MIPLFSEQWMADLKNEWNSAPQVFEPLRKASFSSRVGYGFIGEPQPRGVLVIEHGMATSTLSGISSSEVDWDLRATEDNWKSWIENGFSLYNLGIAFATHQLQFQKGDYAQMLKNPLLSRPFVRHFELFENIQTYQTNSGLLYRLGLKKKKGVIESDNSGQRSGLDLFEAIQAHITWKARFQNAINGESKEVFSPEEVCVDTGCELGKWIHSPFSNIFHDQPHFENLKNTHAEFHKIAGDIVIKIQSNSGESLDQSIDEFNRISRVLIRDLHQLAKFM
ncbi:diguanylate cyclase [mine drainage metagenome]|uniref:Diguanylate cyclase n=1 Tax=mine drainage metagenome TaxID=410659 RepID=A0A1J5RMQ8_9ZZZZ